MLNKLIKLLGLTIILYILYYTVNKESSLFLNSIKIPGETKWGIVHFNSLIFIVGVLLGIVINYFSINSVIFGLRILLTINVPKIRKRSRVLKRKMKVILDKYYEEGIDSITSKDLKNFPTTFKIIINQLQMRIPIDDIYKIIQRQKTNYLNRIEDLVAILSTLASVSPSVGVMGTVIGLIKLLANLKDPSTIGANMSVALMTTLYGLFFSNLIFAPLRRILIEFQDYTETIYTDIEFCLNIIKNNNPAFYSEQNYDKLPKQKK